MRFDAQTLTYFFAKHADVVDVSLSRVQGSSPRNLGTQMFVAADGLWGTVGGGQLEFMAIDHARGLLTSGALEETMDVPLGPSIGQCCGGRVTVSLKRMTASDHSAACATARRAEANLPHVYIHGAGHVGLALSEQFQFLPVHCVLIDSRAEALRDCSADVETRLSALPEADVKNAPAGSAYVVVTHDHALDFLITSSALARGDAAYVGMIGSKTKRATFMSWSKTACEDLSHDTLVCPIGGQGSADKRPSVIAAFVVAEIMATLTQSSHTASQAQDAQNAS